MSELFEIYMVYKWRYINTLPFLTFPLLETIWSNRCNETNAMLLTAFIYNAIVFIDLLAYSRVFGKFDPLNRRVSVYEFIGA